MGREGDEVPQVEGLELLPTGKPHVSFSELSDWWECPYRHKLKHIDKVPVEDRSHYLDFGIAVHASCESYLRTRVMDQSIATDIIRSAWEEHGHAEKEGDIADLEDCLAQAEAILAEVPGWLDATFPGWKCIEAEHLLYERVQDHPHAFKGYIDAAIEVEQLVRGKPKKVVWLLDWKTTTWGWGRDKKQDPHRKRQLIYYKTFWSQKFNIPMSDIKCGFVLLKRTAKKDNRCELLPVSVGDVSSKKSLKVVNNMLKSMKKGIFIKNRYSCKYCPFFETEHCR